jgi:plasmid stabilization system protein ParE
VKILWTETALRHLEEVPRRPAEQILARLETASQFPQMFPARQRGRYRGYHWFPAEDWLVFYSIVDESLIVRGILHGALRDA